MKGSSAMGHFLVAAVMCGYAVLAMDGAVPGVDVADTNLNKRELIHPTSSSLTWDQVRQPPSPPSPPPPLGLKPNPQTKLTKPHHQHHHHGIDSERRVDAMEDFINNHLHKHAVALPPTVGHAKPEAKQEHEEAKTGPKAHVHKSLKARNPPPGQPPGQNWQPQPQPNPNPNPNPNNKNPDPNHWQPQPWNMPPGPDPNHKPQPWNQPGRDPSIPQPENDDNHPHHDANWRPQPWNQPGYVPPGQDQHNQPNPQPNPQPPWPPHVKRRAMAFEA